MADRGWLCLLLPVTRRDFSRVPRIKSPGKFSIPRLRGFGFAPSWRPDSARLDATREIRNFRICMHEVCLIIIAAAAAAAVVVVVLATNLR